MDLTTSSLWSRQFSLGSILKGRRIVCSGWGYGGNWHRDDQNLKDEVWKMQRGRVPTWEMQIPASHGCCAACSTRVSNTSAMEALRNSGVNEFQVCQARRMRHRDTRVLFGKSYHNNVQVKILDTCALGKPDNPGFSFVHWSNSICLEE